MKKLIIAALLGIIANSVMAQFNHPIPGTDGNKYVPYEQRTGNESVVYFTRQLSAEGLIKAYEQHDQVRQHDQPDPDIKRDHKKRNDHCRDTSLQYQHDRPGCDIARLLHGIGRYGCDMTEARIVKISHRQIPQMLADLNALLRTGIVPAFRLQHG